MTEHSMIFTAESVCGILAGTKNQTRRVVKPQPVYGYVMHGGELLPHELRVIRFALNRALEDIHA